jgi:predicted transcriptional regulator
VAEELDLRKIVADVAAAYFANSHVTPSDIPSVIGQIANSLMAIGGNAPMSSAEAVEAARASPAQIRRSISREALISFEDNRPYKTLRRHLAVRGLSPEQYRSKWGLPKDYPMVAPSYSEARSNLAKARGLGSRPMASARPAQPAAAAAEPAIAPAAKSQPKRSRRGAVVRARKPRTTTSNARPSKPH